MKLKKTNDGYVSECGRFTVEPEYVIRSLGGAPKRVAWRVRDATGVRYTQTFRTLADVRRVLSRWQSVA